MHIHKMEAKKKHQEDLKKYKAEMHERHRLKVEQEKKVTEEMVKILKAEKQEKKLKTIQELKAVKAEIHQKVMAKKKAVKEMFDQYKKIESQKKEDRRRNLQMLKKEMALRDVIKRKEIREAI